MKFSVQTMEKQLLKVVAELDVKSSRFSKKESIQGFLLNELYDNMISEIEKILIFTFFELSFSSLSASISPFSYSPLASAFYQTSFSKFCIFFAPNSNTPAATIDIIIHSSFLLK